MWEILVLCLSFSAFRSFWISWDTDNYPELCVLMAICPALKRTQKKEHLSVSQESEKSSQTRKIRADVYQVVSVSGYHKRGGISHKRVCAKSESWKTQTDSKDGFTLKRNGDTSLLQRKEKNEHGNPYGQVLRMSGGKMRATIFSVVFSNNISCWSNLTTTFWTFIFKTTKVLQGIV